MIRVTTDTESFNSSMPRLTSSEASTHEDWLLRRQDTGSDSGVLEELAENVRNLFRRRRLIKVNEEIVTETSPYIPVSLEFTSVDSEDEWEEVLDDKKRPTGVEKKSFRLNINDGRTESTVA